VPRRPAGASGGGVPPSGDPREGGATAGRVRTCVGPTGAASGVSRLWINSLLDRMDAIAGAQLP